MRTRLAFSIVVTMMACIGLAGPARAIPATGPTPLAGDPPPELVITGYPNLVSVNGAMAPSTFNPLQPYPGAPPSGSTAKNVSAGLIEAGPTAGGPPTTRLYCIDILTPTSAGIGYVLGTWDEATVPNVGYVARLLNLYYPNTNEPSSLASVAQRAAAVQTAIWYFTDRYVMNASSSPLRAAVTAIVADVLAKGPVPAPAPPSLAITPPIAEGAVGEIVGPYTVATTSPATITVTGASAFLDAAGTQPLASGSPVANGTPIWLRASSPGSATLAATASATVPHGNVYLHKGAVPKQKLILAQTVTLTTTIRATLTAFATGSITVSKVVAGAGEPLRSAVTVIVTCSDQSSAVFDFPEGQVPTPQTLSGVRAGSTCDLEEKLDGANTEVSVVTTFVPGSSVTIVGNQTVGVTVTNTFTPRPGGLRVTKIVTGELAAQRGDIVINVSCTDDTNVNLTFPASPTQPEPQTVAPIAAGATCTVTETADGSNPPNLVVTVDPATQEVVIPPGGLGQAVITDTYGPGSGGLAVVKVVDPPGMNVFRGPVTIQADCGEEGTFSVTYQPGNPLTPLTVDTLPVGTICTVTETADGATELLDVVTTVDPAEPVAIEAEGTAVVTVTNTYTPRTVQVTVVKTIAGPAAGRQGPVTVVLVCDDGQQARASVPAGGAGPASATLTVPVGTRCWAEELEDGANSEVAVVTQRSLSAARLVEPEPPITIGVVNTYTFRPGSLTVTKSITGPAADRRGPITIGVTCTDGRAQTFTIPVGVTAPPPMLLDGITAGSECTVVETADGATGTTAVYVEGSPVTVVVGPGATETVPILDQFVDAGVLPETGVDVRPWLYAALLSIVAGFGARRLARR